MQELNFMERLHKATIRDYVGRVTAHDKAECATIAKQWGKDYWDGERQYGFGGYHYDGRWRPVAEDIARHYNLKTGDRVLDVGCGKAFLLYELLQIVPGLEIAGIDVSAYALNHAQDAVKPFLQVADAASLPFDDNHFDLVLSITTLHNLPLPRLQKAIREIVRVSKGPGFINTESWRNEREKMNLLYWQLTCESFFDVPTWKHILKQEGYNGDIGFIFFE